MSCTPSGLRSSQPGGGTQPGSPAGRQGLLPKVGAAGKPGNVVMATVPEYYGEGVPTGVQGDDIFQCGTKVQNQCLF